ncbi:MFS transporter [Roseomonas elaeocarpi]|uniref:MFS transporter n=1 Tax=Roseomonas elaeocarpi TaxID=907779 RepID=A0ABV6K075_9PROT
MPQQIETDIPARMDRLPFSRFHMLVIAALGITWVLDGLEVTVVGSLGPTLRHPDTLALSEAEVGIVASAYLAGAVFGSIFFGWLTDRFGRRAIFNVTLGIYIAGVILTAFSWNVWSLAFFRAMTGVGIGGEYASINSAIDELMPARLRGRIDMVVNGSFWGGAAVGAAGSLLLLSGTLVSLDLGWRLGFGIGGVLGIFILLLRRFVPESPRWLITHGRQEEAERVLREIEGRVREHEAGDLPPPEGKKLTIHPKPHFGMLPILRAMLGKFRARSALALTLMIAQAFLFNAVFFTYGLVLASYYNIPEARTGLYILPLAAGNLLGPILLGSLFDTVGRRRMITLTYGLSGLLLLAVAVLFGMGVFTAWTQTIAWMVVFFVASAAASSAYMTASEIFPLESRSLAIALFYAIGTGVGGTFAPWIFGALIATKQPWMLAAGYMASAALMLAAAATEWALGVDAEGQSLESVADPLSS